jgi:hypothetical protein
LPSFFKHLYEHHPCWPIIAKEFNVSKHQQVCVRDLCKLLTAQVMMMQTAELLLSLRDPVNYGRNPLVKF